MLCVTVDALKTISERLNIKVWPSITRSSCDGGGDLENITSSLAGSIYCNCSFPDVVNVNDRVCHIVDLYELVLVFFSIKSEKLFWCIKTKMFTKHDKQMHICIK